MIQATVKLVNDLEKLRKAKERAQRGIMFRNAGLVRSTAKNSIRRVKNRRNVARPGQQPKSHSGRLRKGIVFSVNRSGSKALIGPSRRIVGPIGKLHEFGGRRKQEKFPARPFMGPALNVTRAKLPAKWSGAIRR